MEVSNELKHYGVLGMKWGVRKDRKTGERKHADKAYAKASEKLRKLDAKIVKANQKSEKAYDRYKKADYKAEAARYKADNATRGFISKMQKAGKLSNKARKLKVAYNRSVLKSEKSIKKAEQWYKEMARTFANIKLNNVNQVDLDLGKKYADMVFEQTHKGGKRSAWD